MRDLSVRVLLAAALMCGTAAPAWAEQVETTSGIRIHHGFASLLDYMQWSEPEQRIYAIGVINGIFLSPFFGATKDELAWIEQCVTGMTNVQVAAIFRKYLDDHPERWHDESPAPNFSALIGACEAWR